MIMDLNVNTYFIKMEHDEKYAEISISISNSFTDDIVLNNIFDLSDEQMKKMCDEIIPTFNDEFAQLSEVTNDVFGVLFGVTPVEFDNDVTNISNELLN